MHVILELSSDVPGEYQPLANDVGGDEGGEGSYQIGSEPIIRQSLIWRFVVFEVGQFKYLFKDMKRQVRLFIHYLSDDFDDFAFEYFIIVNETLDK